MVQSKLAGTSPHRFIAGSNSYLAAAVLFLLVMLGVGAVPAHAANFTASLDRDTIAMGEQATLSLTFEGGQSKNVPSPYVPGLQIVQTGTSQNVSIVNGAMTSTVTITFSVTPQQPGEFTIPAMTADLNGQTLTSQPLKLTVVKANPPPAAAINSGNEVAFLRLLLPQQKVYVGQALTLQMQICLRDDVQNFGNFQLNSTPADGFMIGKNATGGRFRTQVGNRSYNVIPVSFALTVTKTGNVSIGPFNASMVVVLPSRNQGDPFFQFFNQGEQKQIQLTTDEINAQSLPLPSEGMPADFNGAIGDFTMAVSAGPTNVAVGDPITVRVQIAGHGAIDSLALPAQNNWNGFKLFPPTTKTAASDQLDLEGTKTFEEIVTPQNTDVHELPALSFSYFNPDEGKYHTLTQPPTLLAIQAAGSTPLPTIAATKPANTENQTPQDILPIKQNMGTLAQAGAPLVASPMFLAAQALPCIAFLAALVWRKRTNSLANNPRLRRRLAVEHLIREGLNELRQYADQNKPDDFFATLFRLLQEQLGERLDCAASAITENVIDVHPVLRSAPKTTQDGLRELFQHCNQARYAPVRGTSELNSVTAQFEKTIGQLQELKA
jgi:hypothetical protein